MKFSIFALFILAFCSKLDASRILFVFPCPTQSHVIVAQGLSTLLAQNGHQVTMLSPFPLSKPMMNHREFQKLLKEEKFDLVVIGMFMNNFWLGLSDQFKCPSIMLSSNAAYTPTNHLFGNPLEVSAVPHMFVLQTEQMNFLQRVKNFLIYSFDHIGYVYFDKLQRDAYK